MNTPHRWLALVSSLLTSLGTAEPVTDSLGLRLVPVPAGTFRMGETRPTPADTFKVASYLKQGDWDEHPSHEVTITRAFLLSEREVTVEQFRVFRPSYVGPEGGGSATGISWDDAVAFCAWMSAKEGRPYRLPTEAEWEYAARAGGTVDPAGTDAGPNPWGLRSMLSGAAEWCADWHGEYPTGPQTDPVGPAAGWARVVRGGGLDKHTPYYARVANRAGMPPNFPPLPLEQLRTLSAGEAAAGAKAPQGVGQQRTSEYRSEFLYQAFTRTVLNNQGNHAIGFRVVCGPAPGTTPPPAFHSLAQLGVRQAGPAASVGPDLARPWFRRRSLLPTPPENTDPQHLRTFRSLGWHRAFLRHHHSPALEVASNGDVLFISFTAVSETDPDVALIATRLRFGADAWDPPDLFLDLPDVDDHAPLLWNDSGRLWLFFGSNKLDSGFPFQWTTSDDHGATWSPIQFPVFTTPVGGHSAQPITNAFRDASGRIYVASDAIGPESVLWQSDTNGQTWRDPGGRSGGRHTTFVLLRDGRILGLGGKSSNIEGFMPQSISSDGGVTYAVSKTIFAHLGSNQRPTCIRLASGRLFLAGDLQSEKGVQPAGFTQRGCYVALSDDEGQTWKVRVLPATQPHERPDRYAAMQGHTLGYAVARQAPNGIIHLVATMTEPCLHYELNEAWILHGAADGGDDAALRTSRATSVREVRTITETNSQGRRTLVASGGIGNDGRYLLHGPWTSFDANGRARREATYALGRLHGRETVRDAEGNVSWTRDYAEDGTEIWITYWPDGQTRTRSTWRDGRAEGEAVLHDPSGRPVYRVEFQHGLPIRESGDPGEH
jgi:hypothetical protein